MASSLDELLGIGSQRIRIVAASLSKLRVEVDLSPKPDHDLGLKLFE